MAYVTRIKQKNLKIKKIIGEGGFSSVYEAKWRQSMWKSQEVAAKKMHKLDKRELEVLARLVHPNIVNLLGVVDENFEFMLVMELCQGGSLRSYLDKTKGTKLSMKHILDWAKQAARPIKYLKEMKIVHKDIKSPNYLIAEGNVLKLCDFGSAKNIDATMSNATMTASYPWMAPELLKEAKLSPSYDIHSYGVVVWELCTTEVPFEGLEYQVIAWKVCNDNERPAIPPDCPEPIADLMRQCWDSDWHNRPSIDHIMTRLSVAESWIQIFEGTWILEKDFGHEGPGELSNAMGISVNSNGDFAIADSMAAQVKVYSTAGDFKFTLDVTQRMKTWIESYPWNVTVSPEGIYYVTDKTQYVKMYDAKGQHKGKWEAVSPDSKASNVGSSKLLGLAMDGRGQLVVGEIKEKYISKHRQDGSHISSMKVNIRPSFLAVTSQDTIVVSDLLMNVVQIVDHRGQELHTLTPLSDAVPWEPRGICCYGNIIFICNNEVSSCKICCFDLSGEYLGAIAVSKCPYNLTFVRESKKLIVVTCWDGVQIYSYHK